MPEQAGKLRAVSGGRRARGKNARELLRRIVDGPPPEGIGRDDLARWEQQLGHGLTVYEAILVTQAAQALEGDLKAAQFVRDTLGEKPGTAPEQAPEALSAAERALIRKLSARLGLDGPGE